MNAHTYYTQDEHDEHCKRIAQELENYANGLYYRTEDGDEVNIEELTDEEREEVEETGEQLTLWDYFTDFFNIDYILDSNRELKAVRVMVACGGPNIYIDTETEKVELYWWTERGEAYIDRDVCEDINEVFRELFYC